MPFFTRDMFDEKLAKKSFKLLKRMKLAGFDESEIECLLCADSSILLAELILCTKAGVMYLPRLTPALNKYDFSAISAVTIEVVNAYPSISLTIANGDRVKLYVASKSADEMAEYIKQRLPAPGGVISAADEIAKYKSLLDAGAITDTEYEAKKKQLLGL